MASEIVFFSVGNGDMVLVRLDDARKTRILIDINVRNVSDSEEDICDVKEELLKLIEKDKSGRPFVDVFLLTHPDHDHCRGLENNFHLGQIEDYKSDDEDKKIIIHEIWSSPLVFRRASSNHTLSEDAKAFNKEAKRRVQVYRDKKKGIEAGDRIIIIEEDENGKTDDLKDILVKVDEEITVINGKSSDILTVKINGPLSKQKMEEDEEKLKKNHSSVICQFNFKIGETDRSNLYLCGGDAEVEIWSRLWGKYKSGPSRLEYDVLLAPHHCSWHTLSYDSWSRASSPKVDNKAKNALSQSRSGALIVSSSNKIKDDDVDPPCWGAKAEYEKTTKDCSGEFVCLDDYYNDNSRCLVVKLTKDGPQGPAKKSDARLASAVISSSTREPFKHGLVNDEND